MPVRRIIRESFRLHQEDLVHYHVVAIANPGANKATRQDYIMFKTNFGNT